MAKNRTPLVIDFQEIDAASLPPQARMAYDRLKVARKAASEARDAFETLAREAIAAPTGLRAVFGYNFGKLSVGMAKDDAPKSSGASRKAVSLTDWLKTAR